MCVCVYRAQLCHYLEYRQSSFGSSHLSPVAGTDQCPHLAGGKPPLLWCAAGRALSFVCVAACAGVYRAQAMPLFGIVDRSSFGSSRLSWWQGQTAVLILLVGNPPVFWCEPFPTLCLVYFRLWYFISVLREGTRVFVSLVLRSLGTFVLIYVDCAVNFFFLQQNYLSFIILGPVLSWLWSTVRMNWQIYCE